MKKNQKGVILTDVLIGLFIWGVVITLIAYYPMQSIKAFNASRQETNSQSNIISLKNQIFTDIYNNRCNIKLVGTEIMNIGDVRYRFSNNEVVREYNGTKTKFSVGINNIYMDSNILKLKTGDYDLVFNISFSSIPCMEGSDYS